MNVIAMDIGNTALKAAFFLNDTEQQLVSLSFSETAFDERLGRFLADCWDQVPLVESAAQPVREGVIVVSSVNPGGTDRVRDICMVELGEAIKVVGQEIPLPIETSVDSPLEVGTDRLITAAAAYSVVEDAVVVADFGTAVTIDLVDETGVFVGGTISPGFEMALASMHDHTAKLPDVAMQKPASVYGANTAEAMRAGVYWAAVGLLETLCRKYAEQLGRWPHVVLTGGGAALFKDDCDFVDSYVPNLAVRGIMVAWKKFVFETRHLEELDEDNAS